MVLQDGTPKLYALRWRFTYSDGKPDKVGVWGQSGSKENHACFTSKENLRHAFIEGRCTRTHKVCVFHEINGQQFENFQWLGRVVRQNLPGVETQKLAPSIIGARIVGRDFIYSVDILGNTSRNVRSEEDKKVIFHGTGK